MPLPPITEEAFFHLVDHIFYTQNIVIIRIINDNAFARVRLVDDLSVADIQRNVRTASVSVTDDIAWLNLAVIDTSACGTQLSGGRTTDRITEIRIYKTGKA